MQYVTLINRTSKTLFGTWDGRRYELLPKSKNAFPEIMAQKFKEQNPVMGSEDPYSLDKDYLLGIEELNDPITPIEQTQAVERINRKKFNGAAADAEVVKTNAGGLYAHERQSPLSADSNFTKA